MSRSVPSSGQTAASSLETIPSQKQKVRGSLTHWKSSVIAELESEAEISSRLIAGATVQIVPQKAYEKLSKHLEASRLFEPLRFFEVNHNGRLQRYVALLCEPGFDSSKGLKGSSNPRSGRKPKLSPEEQPNENKSYKVNEAFRDAIQAMHPDIKPDSESFSRFIRLGIEAIRNDLNTWESFIPPEIKTEHGKSNPKICSMRFSQSEWNQVKALKRSRETNSTFMKRLLYVGALSSKAT